MQTVYCQGSEWVFSFILASKPLTERSRIQDYSDLLIEKYIIHDTSPFHDGDLLTCPLCQSPLRSCQEGCATVACSNSDCAGSQVVACEQCDLHSFMTCHECLQVGSKEPNLLSSFVCCPTCHSWCCRHDVDWCPGTIIHPTLDKDLVKISKQKNFDDTSFVRSHSPVPGPCRSCGDSGFAEAWQACNGVLSALCPSRAFPLYELELRGTYCPVFRAQRAALYLQRLLVM